MYSRTRGKEHEPTPWPARLILVTGTTTGVGKTWVGAKLLAALRAEGATVAARKPVQSFGGRSEPTDADVLARATGEEPAAVCPRHRWYEVPMAPPMAAEELGRDPFTLDDLMSEMGWPSGVDYGLAEGAGGPRSPLASGADTIDLARALRPDHTVLVAHGELGSINSVLLCVGALPPPAPVVFLNRYADNRTIHRLNAEWLRRREGLDVFTSMEELLSHLRR